MDDTATPAREGGGAPQTITRRDDGTWTGTLTAEGKSVTADGEGPQGVSLALARMWLTGQDGTSKPAAPPAAKPAVPAAAKPAHPAPRPFPVPKPKPG